MFGLASEDKRIVHWMSESQFPGSSSCPHGNGGGSKNFAQGGGSDASDIANHLKVVKENIMTL